MFFLKKYVEVLCIQHEIQIHELQFQYVRLK